MRVLVVDDSDIVRERLNSVLSEIPGVEIIGEADTTQDAIEAVRRLNPDIILLDIRLRIGNGIDVLYSVKQKVSPPIVIMFTSYPYPHYRKRCQEEGADYFFNKKDEFEKVVELLAELGSQKTD